MNLHRRLQTLEHAGARGRYIVVERLNPGDVEPEPNGRVYARFDESVTEALIRFGHLPRNVAHVLCIHRR